MSQPVAFVHWLENTVIVVFCLLIVFLILAFMVAAWPYSLLVLAVLIGIGSMGYAIAVWELS